MVVVGRWKLRQRDLYVEVVGSKNWSLGISTRLNIIVYSVVYLIFARRCFKLSQRRFRIISVRDHLRWVDFILSARLFLSLPVL